MSSPLSLPNTLPPAVSNLFASVSLHHQQQLQQQVTAQQEQSTQLPFLRYMHDMCPDFYYYDVDAHIWVKITDDTQV